MQCISPIDNPDMIPDSDIMHGKCKCNCLLVETTAAKMAEGLGKLDNILFSVMLHNPGDQHERHSRRRASNKRRWQGSPGAKTFAENGLKAADFE